MKVHVLVEDKVRRRGFIAEHGLSLFIEDNQFSILFDVGATDIFIHNAKQKELNLDHLDYVIISHGHYDHGNGLDFLIPALKTKILIQEVGLDSKYAKEQENYREIGLSNKSELIKRLDSNIIKLNGDYQINEKVRILNSLSSKNDFERVAPEFYVSKNRHIVKDLFTDEQILVINSNKGLIVFSGCSHLGIVNWLDRVQQNYPNVPIYALFAGMHLEKASEMQLNKTIEKLSQANISHIYPIHCTGFMATAKIKEHFLDKCSILYTGDTVEI